MSTNQKDPGYEVYEKHCLLDSKDVLVTLDGEEVICLTADEQGGYVVVFDRQDGKLRRDVNGDEVLKARTGKVKIYVGWRASFMRWWKGL